MKHINKKKIMSIVLAGFVLLTISGCADKGIIEDRQTTINDNNTVVEVPKETPVQTPEEKQVVLEKQETVVVNGGTMTESYVQEITTEEVPVISQNNVMTEEETVNYFERIEAKVNEYANSENFENMKDKASSLFITTVDFIFYGGEIKGVTYDSLSNSAKLKILNIAKRIDTTIMTKWPTYKEDVKTTSGKVFSNVTSKIGEGISYVDGKLNEKLGEENYSDLKDNTIKAVDEIKDTAGTYYEKGKDAATNAKEKVKSWYENYRNKKNSTE